MPWRVGARLDLDIVDIAQEAVRGKSGSSKIVWRIAQRKIDSSDEVLAAAEIADGTRLVDCLSHRLLHQYRGPPAGLRQDGNQL